MISLLVILSIGAFFAMKQFLILSIFICLAGAKTLFNENDIKFQGKEKIAMAECAKELNVDEEKYDHPIDLDEYEKNPNEETTCMMACGTRKLMSKDLTGFDNKATLYNGFSKLIEGAYKKGFGNETSKFTHEEVVNKVENCYESAQDECDFFKCVEFYESPMIDLYVYFAMNSVADTIFGADS